MVITVISLERAQMRVSVKQHSLCTPFQCKLIKIERLLCKCLAFAEIILQRGIVGFYFVQPNYKTTKGLTKMNCVFVRQLKRAIQNKYSPAVSVCFVKL